MMTIQWEKSYWSDSQSVAWLWRGSYQVSQDRGGNQG